MIASARSLQGSGLTLVMLAGAFIGTALCAPLAYADTPAITSFSIAPQSIGNDYSTLVSWSFAAASGADIYFDCPNGVTVKRSDGSAIACRSRTSLGATNPGSLAIVVTNVSGTPKMFAVTLYPKDSSGTDYDAGSKAATLTVAAAAQPITDFSVSTTLSASGGSVVFTWTGVDIAYANMQFTCSDGVQIFGSGTSPLPCGTPAFSPSLSASGSVTVKPVNTASLPVSVTAFIIPGIAAGEYDLTHAQSAVFSVLNKPPVPAPSVDNFNGSQGSVLSGAPVTLSWSTHNASGAAIQFACNDALSFASIVGTSSTPLPCNAPAFSAALSSSGSTTISVTNKSPFLQNVAATLMPQDGTGTYLATLGRTISIAVLPPGTALPVPIVVASSSSFAASSTSSIASSTSGTLATHAHEPITISLARGSRGAQVNTLQTFLALDSAIYPEGVVNGYYGPATKRAVQRFQVRHGVAKKGDAGYGSVGRKTRAAINALQMP